MRGFRLSGLVAAIALGMLPVRALGQGFFPYETRVLSESRNNLLDVSAGACSSTLGCFDNQGNLCSANPDEECDLRVVPAGRCSQGTSACVWPEGGGFCQSNSDIPCLSNNGTTTGPSSMCPAGGTCDMQTNDPACACDGAVAANAAIGEYTVCGGLYARCSDGDPFRPFRGKPTQTCIAEGLFFGSGTPRSGCGDSSGKDETEFGPRWQQENPPEVPRSGTRGAGSRSRTRDRCGGCASRTCFGSRRRTPSGCGATRCSGTPRGRIRSSRTACRTGCSRACGSPIAAGLRRDTRRSAW